MTNQDKEQQYRLLRRRQHLEEQVERFETSTSPRARADREQQQRQQGAQPSSQPSAPPPFNPQEEVERQKRR